MVRTLFDPESPKESYRWILFVGDLAFLGSSIASMVLCIQMNSTSWIWSLLSALLFILLIAGLSIRHLKSIMAHTLSYFLTGLVMLIGSILFFVGGFTADGGFLLFMAFVSEGLAYIAYQYHGTMTAFYMHKEILDKV